MFQRKNVSKNVSLRWFATPYKGVWAFGPEGVPIWDESRGFPKEFQGVKLHVADSTAAAGNIPEGEDVVVRDEVDTDLDVLRKWIGDEWSPRPVSTRARGFPWFVRADYTEPLQLEDCTEVDVVGLLNVLARHYPLKGHGYDKIMLREIATLNAAVGQPRGGTNTLRTWLELALTVKAHLETRKDLNDMGGDVDPFHHELVRKDDEWRNDPSHRQMFSRHWSPYKFLASVTQNASTRADVVDAIRDDLQTKFSDLEGAFLFKGGLVTQSSLWDWTHYRLLEVWGKDAQLKPCAGCDTLFFARRKNQTHCHPRCRVHAYDARQAQS